MTDFSLENLLRQANAVGMNQQLQEGLHYVYGRDMGRYLDTHPRGSEPEKHRIPAAQAWGYLAGRQYIKAYNRKKNDYQPI